MDPSIANAGCNRRWPESGHMARSGGFQQFGNGCRFFERRSGVAHRHATRRQSRLAASGAEWASSGWRGARSIGSFESARFGGMRRIRVSASAGHLDALRIPSAPLDVLAQVLLGMSIEQEWTCDEAFDVVKRAGPYLDLSREDFDEVLRYLSGQGKVLGPYGTYGKIVLENGRFHVAKGKTARNYYMNLGVISSDVEMKVVLCPASHVRSSGRIVYHLAAADEAFIMGGKPVRVKQIHQNTAVVEPAQGENVKTPALDGEQDGAARPNSPTKNCGCGATSRCLARRQRSRLHSHVEKRLQCRGERGDADCRVSGASHQSDPGTNRFACSCRTCDHRPKHVGTCSRRRRPCCEPITRLGMRGPYRAGAKRSC